MAEEVEPLLDVDRHVNTRRVVVSKVENNARPDGNNREVLAAVVATSPHDALRGLVHGRVADVPTAREPDDVVSTTDRLDDARKCFFLYEHLHVVVLMKPAVDVVAPC